MDDPPLMHPNTPRTVIPFIENREIASGLTLETEFCISFEFMLRHVGLLTDTKTLLEISSQEFGPIFFLVMRSPHVLAVSFAEEGVRVADLVVDSNVFKVFHDMGKWIKMEVLRLILVLILKFF